MFGNLLRTQNDAAALFARLALGIVMLPHGCQKVLGWFGGYGLAGTWGFMTGTMHIPAIFAALAIAAEFLGALGLIFGCLGRIAAFGVGVEMVVAAIVGGHVHNGFFMNWAGKGPGEGFEYHILAIAISAAVLIGGAGRWSVDSAIAAKLEK